MNEILRQALLRAGLTDEAVAAQLGVDPKTVRRWLEGRHPYPRLRSQLALLLATDEIELWPGLATGPGAISSSPEVVAVYPHLSSVPGELWRELLTSATRQIGILASISRFAGENTERATLLRSRAAAGVRIRIALTASEQPRDPATGDQLDTEFARETHEATRMLRPLLEMPAAEIRLQSAAAYNSMLIADDDILISHRIFGIEAAAAPVLRLRGTENGDLTSGYLDSFESIWQSATALPIS
jgi:transcriptional regulator with XRE-family HTH domain